MRTAFGLKRLMAVVAGLALLATAGRSNPVAPDQLPEPVAKTFKAMFPSGTIEKLSSAEENGTTVYDFEFRAGGREMETDIVSDGTMIESTLVIVGADIPARPMKAIQKAAKGAKLGRLEWIHTLYEIEEGKAVKLAPAVVKYAAEMERRNQTAEIIVAADGSVLEAPVWVSNTPPKAPADAKTAK